MWYHIWTRDKHPRPLVQKEARYGYGNRCFYVVHWQRIVPGDIP